MLFRVNFGRALIISFLWHLICFFAVTIVIIPQGAGYKKLSSISFLGSILDDGSLSRELNNFEAVGHKPHGGENLLPRDHEAAERYKFYSGADYLTEAKPYRASIDEVLLAEKKLPGDREDNQASLEKKRPYEVGGEARDRAILFRPPQEDILTSASGEGAKNIAASSYRIKQKLVIAANGDVKSVENLETTGYPELDLAAVRYTKKWKFTPLSPNKPQYDQEGVVFLDITSDIASRPIIKENDTKR